VRDRAPKCEESHLGTLPKREKSRLGGDPNAESRVGDPGPAPCLRLCVGTSGPGSQACLRGVDLAPDKTQDQSRQGRKNTSRLAPQILKDTEKLRPVPAAAAVPGEFTAWGLQQGTATRRVGRSRGPAAFPSVAPRRNTPDLDGRTRTSRFPIRRRTGHAPKAYLSA